MPTLQKEVVWRKTNFRSEIRSMWQNEGPFLYNPFLFIKFKNMSFMYTCVCLSVCVCALCIQGTTEVRRGITSPGTELRMVVIHSLSGLWGGSIYWKSSKCSSLPGHLSSSPYKFQRKAMVLYCMIGGQSIVPACSRQGG